MAIEIIPKPKVKKVPWLKIALSILSALFLVFLLSYFILIFYQTKLEKELLELEKKLVRTPVEEALEKNLSTTKKQIENWKLIVKNHPLTLRVFEFLEKNSHPQVWFSDFKLNLEKASIDLKAQAGSSEALGQQLLIFKKQELIKEATLSKVSIDKEGKILFDLRLDLDPKIFSPTLSSEIK